MTNPTADLTAKFDAILKADQDVRRASLIAQAGMYVSDRERGRDQYVAAKARRSALVLSLSADELVAFNDYRQGR